MESELSAVILSRLSMLETEIARVSDENKALRHCLQSSGLLRSDAVLAHVHRSSFERTCKKHPIFPAAPELDKVSPDVFLLVGRFLGRRVEMSRASSALHTLHVKLPSFSRDVIFALGGCNHEDVVHSVWRFDPRQDGAWSTVSPMPTERFGACVVAVRGHIYALGGGTEILGLQMLNAMERYEPTSDTWVDVAAMPTMRTHFAAAAFGRHIFAIGGENLDLEASPVVEQYDTEEGMWHAVPSVKEARAFLAASLLGGSIYALGGLNRAGNRSAAVERLDFFSGSFGRGPAIVGGWRFVAPLRVPRDELSASSAAGRIFAVGGSNGAGETMAAVECYDPAADAWVEIAPMRSLRCGHTAAVLDGQIYVFGGYVSLERRCFATAERYNPRTDVWESVEAMPAGCKYLSAASVRVYE